MSTDEEAQEDEMLAMESIFEPGQFQMHSASDEIRSGQILIRLELPEPFFISVDVEVDPEDWELITIPGLTTGAEARYRVEFLPPLTLHFTLPKNYPSEAKPNFTLSATWLHRASLSILCQKLDELWEENKGMGILFTWSNYLQANAITDLGILDFYNVDWIKKPMYLSWKRVKRAVRRQSATGSSSSQVNISVLDESSVNLAPTTEDSIANEGEINESLTISNAAKEFSDEYLTAEVLPSTSSVTVDVAGSSKPPKVKRRKEKKAKKKIKVDQRAALDAVPRKDGKDVSLVDYLLSYNDELIQETFQQSSHSCEICFNFKIGHSCVRFLCSHVFCEECVTACFTTHITEGNVDQVKCPAFNCKIRPTPEVVKKLVGPTLYERYDEILLKRALENMSDITYCPRPKCHNPVIRDENDKCASCTVCGYTFCSICKMVYHGVEPCRFKNADMKEVFRKYTQGTVEEKKILVKAYGEKQLKVLCENMLSEEWIQQESKKCPHCKVPIEKFEGCNKVTCFKCNTYFCWLCLKQLEHGNPYFHFNDPNSPCYNNLFQNVEGDDDDFPGNEWIVNDEEEVTDEDDEAYLDHDDDYDYDSDYDPDIPPHMRGFLEFRPDPGLEEVFVDHDGNEFRLAAP